jgi:hypothetical protein
MGKCGIILGGVSHPGDMRIAPDREGRSHRERTKQNLEIHISTVAHEVSEFVVGIYVL